MGWKIMVLSLLLFLYREPRMVESNSAVDDTTAAAAKAKDNLAKLYTVIRDVALPPVNDSATGDEPVNQRLVLLLPGKVLSYNDYFPGDEYEASLEDPLHEGRQVPIPPRVMDNMFQLADIIPGIDPLRGAESGESMAITYENILNQIEVKGFAEKTETEKERYLTALEFLAEEIPDPLNVTENVTRFQLYRRSQDLYNQKRLDMEDLIASKREELSSIEFEHWFQRNYPSLNSGVEGAYTEWLIFGQKEVVELYKSYLDVESPGIDLQEARMALRGSGLAALDRTRTIYPVSFTPSNWYRYLTNVTAVDIAQQERVRDQIQLTRDEILARIGEYESKKRVLVALRDATSLSGSLTTDYNNLEQNLNSSNDKLTDFATKVETKRQECLSGRIRAKAGGSSDEITACTEYESMLENSTDLIFGNSELYACVKDLGFQVNDVDSTKESINGIIQEINEEISELNQDLRRVGAKYPSLARHAADSQDQLDSRWLQFNFNSQRYEYSSRASSRYYSVAASTRASGWFWSVSASYSRSRSESSFQSSMNRAGVKVKGELLRVTVNRPWFRPSLFKSNHFQPTAATHLNGQSTLKVSPGPLSEAEFVREVKSSYGTTNPSYLLPQYVTGLLLSRNVEVEFTTSDASTSAHAVRVASSASVSGGIGPWRASFSYSGGRSRRTMNFASTSTGLRVTIPGAQVIGYYTQVVPRFPKDN